MSELLVNILEKYKARGEDEQNFADKHTDNVEVTNAPGREGSSEGEKRKKHNRAKNRQGYEPGEDEEVYEARLLDIIDEAISELAEDLDDEERAALYEMIEDDTRYEEFVESVFAESDLEMFLEESDEDDEDDEDEDDEEAEVETEPKEKKNVTEAADDVLEEGKAAKFKVGAKVKIDKPGHEWHGKTGEVLKSKTFDRTKKGVFAVGIKGTLASNRFNSDELTLAEDTELEEGLGFSKWSVELPSFKKTAEVVKARNKAEAIKRAVAKAGGKPDDWKHTKIGKVEKLSEEVLEEGNTTFTWTKVNSVLQHKGYNPKKIADLSVKLKGKLNGGKVKWTDLNSALVDSDVSTSNISKLLIALKQ